MRKMGGGGILNEEISSFFILLLWRDVLVEEMHVT